jgi:hypothetical protein
VKKFCLISIRIYHRTECIYSKTINAVEPGTIPASLINKKDKLNRYEITENHVAALRYAKQIGIHIINMGPTDFMEGKVHLVLGLLWQLVRVSKFLLLLLPVVIIITIIIIISSYYYYYYLLCSY